MDARSGLPLAEDGPQDGADDVGRRVRRVEARVQVGRVASLLVLDAERRVLHGQRPRQPHALVDVAQQTGAPTQAREVVQRVPDALANLLLSHIIIITSHEEYRSRPPRPLFLRNRLKTTSI